MSVSPISSGAVLQRSVDKQFMSLKPLCTCSTVQPALYQIPAPQAADELKPFRPAINFSLSASLTSGKSVSKEPAAAVTLTGKSTVPSHPLATRTGEGME